MMQTDLKSLNWAVAKCLGYLSDDDVFRPNFYKYSTDWSMGGPIIEQQKISLAFHGDIWVATIEDCSQFGPTPLIAAMRCLVAFRM